VISFENSARKILSSECAPCGREAREKGTGGYGQLYPLRIFFMMRSLSFSYDSFNLIEQTILNLAKRRYLLSRSAKEICLPKHFISLLFLNYFSLTRLPHSLAISPTPKTMATTKLSSPSPLPRSLVISGLFCLFFSEELVSFGF
jgi:hypothetical protein